MAAAPLLLLEELLLPLALPVLLGTPLFPKLMPLLLIPLAPLLFVSLPGT